MSRSQVTVRVRRPAQTTFDCIASHAWTNEPAWEPEVLGVEPESGTLRLGGRVAMTRRDYGKVRTTTYVITALEPPRRLAIAHVDGPMRFALEFVVTPVAGGESDVTVTVDVGLRGTMRLMAPVFALTGRRQTARISGQMVRAIEAATSSTGAAVMASA